MMAGELDVELVPQGTLIERIRAGGYGLGGVLTKTGIGTPVEEGKKKIDVNGNTYLLELPLRADFALVHAFVADYLGNVAYALTARNFNPLMAMAAETVLDLPDDQQEIGRKAISGFRAGCIASLKGFRPARVAELHTTGPGRGQSFFGALRDRITFHFGKNCHHLDHGLIGVRIVHSNKISTGFEQVGNEGKVAAQPVQFGNNELRLLLLTGYERSSQLRPIRMLAQFDLGEFTDQLPAAAVQIVQDGFSKMGLEGIVSKRKDYRSGCSGWQRF
jgi:Coenzyme A transferase